MIERPTPAGAGVAQAGAETREAANAAPAPAVVPAAECGAHVLAANGPDPSLAPPVAPPRFMDRPRQPFEPTASRAAARRTSRAAMAIEGMTYRAVFACCMEATDTPTE